MDNSARRFFKVSEISRLTGIPDSSLYFAIQQKEIRAIKLRSRIYVPTDEVERLLGEQGAESDGGNEAA